MKTKGRVRTELFTGVRTSVEKEEDGGDEADVNDDEEEEDTSSSDVDEG